MSTWIEIVVVVIDVATGAQQYQINASTGQGIFASLLVHFQIDSVLWIATDTGLVCPSDKFCPNMEGKIFVVMKKGGSIFHQQTRNQEQGSTLPVKKRKLSQTVKNSQPTSNEQVSQIIEEPHYFILEGKMPLRDDQQQRDKQMK